MSTSPSWFDQEKFSRLVKKVGPKTVTEQLPSVAGTDAENRENLASTARISLVSKPPSLLAEQRALPALPRRTTPLPSLKALFPTPVAPAKPAPAPAAERAESPTESPASAEDNEEVIEATEEPDTHMIFETEHEALAETWQKMSLLNDELARAIHERDQAITEGQILRDQLRKAEEAHSKKESVSPGRTGELARVTRERDDSIAQLQAMREQAIKKLEAAKELRSPSKTQEMVLLEEERDSARKQYMDLRRQFEALKLDQTEKSDTQSRIEAEKQLEDLRQKLAARDKEISELKAKGGSGTELGRADDKLVASLREQLAKAKEEASIAQRGLALSQKALHETRDTLREATEGSSLSRHNFDNLKNECAILAQQNTVLQAQNDQLTKDLAAAKSKLTTRL
jgi:hypothetical protein